MVELNTPALKKACDFFHETYDLTSSRAPQIAGIIETYLEEAGDVCAPLRLSNSIWKASQSAIEDGASLSEVKTAANVAKNLPPQAAAIVKWFVSGEDGICFVFSEGATPIITVEGRLLHLSVPPATANEHFVEDVKYADGEIPQEILKPLLAVLQTPLQEK